MAVKQETIEIEDKVDLNFEDAPVRSLPEIETADDDENFDNAEFKTDDELRDDNSRAKSQTPDVNTEAMRLIVEQLSELKKPQDAPKSTKKPDTTPQFKRIDTKDKEKEWKDKLYDDPAKVLLESGQIAALNTFGPILQTYQKQIQELTELVGRGQLEGNTDSTYIMSKYADEVESALTELPKSPSAYKKALRLVMADHIDELRGLSADTPKKPVPEARGLSGVNGQSNNSARSEKTTYRFEQGYDMSWVRNQSKRTQMSEDAILRSMIYTGKLTQVGGKR